MEAKGKEPGAKHHILVVEDDPDVREIVSSLLADEGYRIQTASNGQEALSLLLSGTPPCLVLLDLMMPVMNGWQVVSAIRDHGRLSSIPIVVTSAFADRAPANVDRVLKKPLNLDSLLSAVEEFCPESGDSTGSSC
jgi:CheY-like chemotaxis protein